MQAGDKRVKAKEMENPFYNEEEGEEEESDKDALPQPVSVTKTAAENHKNGKDDEEKGGEVGGAPGTDMPDQNGRGNGNEAAAEDVGENDTEDGEDNVEKSSENGDDGGDKGEDTEEDLLELEVNPDEFEDLGVDAANSSQDKESSVEQEEEEIEIIEHVVNLKETEEDGPKDVVEEVPMRINEAEDRLDGNVHGPIELDVPNNSEETKNVGEPEMVGVAEAGNVPTEMVVDGGDMEFGCNGIDEERVLVMDLPEEN